MKNQEAEKMKDEFQVYLMQMDDALAELEKDIRSIEKISHFGLDFSMDSLDIAEQYLGHLLATETEKGNIVEIAITRISTYMGEIARKTLKGKWELCVDEDDLNYGLPCVGKLKGYDPAFAWCPIRVLFNFRNHHERGLLKRATKTILDPDSDDE